MRNRTKKYYLVICFLWIGLTSVLAQQVVDNKAFDSMLQGLLAHSVSELGPEAIALDPNVILLDAREKAEFNISHLQEAIWVGFDDFKLKRVKHLDKNKKVVVYCSVGYRSEKIAERIQKAGFTDVHNLYGGIFEWVHQGHKIYDKKGVTQKVHTFNEEWSQWLTKGIKIY